MTLKDSASDALASVMPTWFIPHGGRPCFFMGYPLSCGLLLDAAAPNAAGLIWQGFGAL